MKNIYGTGTICPMMLPDSGRLDLAINGGKMRNSVLFL